MLGTKPCLLKIQLECQSVLNNNRIARKTRFDCNKWNINEIRNEQSLYLSSKFPGRRFKFNGTFYLCLAKVRVVCMLIRPFWNKEDHSNPGGSDKIYFTLLTYVLCIWDYGLSRGHVSEVLPIIDNWIKKLKIKSLTNGKNKITWLELSLKSFIWIVSSVWDFIDWSKPPVCCWQLSRISSNNPAKNPKNINKDLIWKRKFCLRISQSCSDRKKKAIPAEGVWVENVSVIRGYCSGSWKTSRTFYIFWNYKAKGILKKRRFRGDCYTCILNRRLR